MSDELWVVRAGKEAVYAQEFLDHSYVAIDFSTVAADDLSLTTPDALKARATTKREKVHAAQLATFAYRMEPGDLVIVPRLSAKHRSYYVARIAGPYQHVDNGPESGRHRRHVEWLGRFEKDALSVGAVNTLGAILTLFRPSAVEAELRGLLTALLPIEASGSTPATPTQPVVAVTTSVTPVAVVQPITEYFEAQIHIDLDNRGRARIVCDHPALVMEQMPRHVDPSGSWSGVPGIYVLTGTHLEHSSTRTGKERTLTTTLIVRPWAYIGLSEGIVSRLATHRQSKPEWRRALVVRSGGTAFTSDDIKYLENRIYGVLAETGEVTLGQSKPHGNVSALPKNTIHLDACSETIVAVLRLTGTLI